MGVPKNAFFADGGPCEWFLFQIFLVPEEPTPRGSVNNLTGGFKSTASLLIDDKVASDFVWYVKSYAELMI